MVDDANDGPRCPLCAGPYSSRIALIEDLTSIIVDHRGIRLSKMEFGIFKHLVREFGRVISAEEIAKAEREEISSVASAMSNIDFKIHRSGLRLHNRRAVGYYLAWSR